MGFAFTTGARDRGALVMLVSAAGGGIEDVACVPIETVASLRTALLDLSLGADILVMAAAVSDFRVASPASWNGEYTAPPEPWDEHGEVVNASYRAWVCATFGVTIPRPPTRSSPSRPRWATTAPLTRSAG